MWLRLSSPLAGAVALFALSGCVNVPETQVRSIPDTSELIPPGHSLIVFVRPHYYGPSQPFFIVYQDGTFVAELPSESRLHLVVRAGRHTFIGWHHALMGDYGQSTLVTGDVLPGRAYVIQIHAGEYPMQFLSMPLAVPNCGLVDQVMAAKRVAPDPGASSSMFPPGKVTEQIEEAWERYEDRKGERRYFWNFHNRGGTYEMFFARDRGKTYKSVFGEAGAGMLCQRVRGRYQGEVSMHDWVDYFNDTSPGGGEWKLEKAE